MRKNQEINKAVAILRKKGDLVSLEQASVLSDRLNERSVFDKYVAGVAEADRSEGIYYACRDAARFLKGELTLDELIPDHEQEDDIEPVEEMITITASEFRELLRRVERLDRRAGLQKKISATKRKRVEDISTDDLISQIDACKYIGCSKTTIKRWADNGFITGYQKGLNVYYSKRELNRSVVVKEHRLNRKEAEHE